MPAKAWGFPQAYGLIVDNPGICEKSHKYSDTPILKWKMSVI